jgi:hypothetical protein
MDTLSSAPNAVNLPGPSAAEAAAVAKLIGHPPENAPAKPRRKVRSLYRSIDVHRSEAEAWPAVIPPLTEAEAKTAGKRLYRAFMRKPWKGDVIVSSGNRASRIRWATISPTSEIAKRRRTCRVHALVVNPGAGWKELVHDLSHTFHWRLRPKDRPHSDNHLALEKDMVAYVVSNGWLDGKLKPKARPKKPAPNPAIVEHDRVLARIKAWETKAKRAATALAKLRKEETKLRRRRPLFTLD